MGKTYSKPVILQFRDHSTGFVDQDTAKKWYKEQGVVIKKNGKTLLFPQGNISWTRTLRLESTGNWYLLPGAELEFINGAVLKVRGPIYSLGT